MSSTLDWRILFAGLLLLGLPSGEASQRRPDPARDLFPTAQAELRDVVEALADDNMSQNIADIQALHLDSEKFSKFGPRRFSRQDVASTNESEAAFFGALERIDYEIEDLKIDVFGDVGVVTYYPRVVFVRDGEETRARGRQTLVFLKTDQGWKIVHEHGTPSW